MKPELLGYCRDYDVPVKAGAKYYDSLIKHISNVQTAGIALGVPDAQLAIHDASKFTEAEFPHYARKFHGDNSDPGGFANAWLHHQNHNPHHWEYWVTRNTFSVHIKEYIPDALPMPTDYTLEMIADWQGASLTYTSSLDMTEWLTDNLPKITLHPDTRKFVYHVLGSLGYGEEVVSIEAAVQSSSDCVCGR